MADADIAQTGLAQAVARFPEAAATLRGMALADPAFREICEEYALAQAEPRRGSRRAPTPPERPEIGDYRTVIAELEERDRPDADGRPGRGADDTRREARHKNWRALAAWEGRRREARPTKTGQTR